MEFLITAYDGVDGDAMERRLAARGAHLEGIKQLKQNGHFIQGGAILNSEGRMIGSTLYMEFGSRAECDEWLRSDPYVTGGVWVDLKVEDIRLVLRG